MSKVLIGSARIDENGNARGGAAGDQKQAAVPDYTGEVAQQEFYVHRLGWYVLRPKDPKVAVKIADKMIDACDNPNIGYDQGNRLGVIKHGINSAVKTGSDCSSLTRACVLEATGRDPGDYTTSGETSALEATGLFEKRKAYVSGMTLYTGDILVTKTKGHTVIVTYGARRTVGSSDASTNSQQPAGSVLKVQSAKSFSKAVAGSYKPSTTLNMRTGPGTKNPILKELSPKATVKCYGYYTMNGSTKWLLCVELSTGVKGFCSSKYLKKM